jgi:hypothetical protein
MTVGRWITRRRPVRPQCEGIAAKLGFKRRWPLADKDRCWPESPPEAKPLRRASATHRNLDRLRNGNDKLAFATTAQRVTRARPVCAAVNAAGTDTPRTAEREVAESPA